MKKRNAKKSITKVTSKKKSSIQSKKKISTPKGLAAEMFDNVEKIAERIENMFLSRPSDIAAAIKMEHEALRNFMGILKDTDRDMTERCRAYSLFSDLLKLHLAAEEKFVYVPSTELPGKEMNLKVAEDLMKRIQSAESPVEWCAHANVLSENIEHHLKEEERDFLPLVRKTLPAKQAQEMLNSYLQLRSKTQAKVTYKNAGVLASVEKT